jgi:hypothetical protein
MASGKESTRQKIGNRMVIIGLLLMALMLAFGLMCGAIAIVDIARGDGMTEAERAERAALVAELVVTERRYNALWDAWEGNTLAMAPYDVYQLIYATKFAIVACEELLADYDRERIARNR